MSDQFSHQSSVCDESLDAELLRNALAGSLLVAVVAVVEVVGAEEWIQETYEL